MRVIGFVRVEMCEWSSHNVRVNMKSASDWLCASGPVIMCECGDVRVEMCEWSSHNVRMNMECASDQLCASRNV